MTVTLRTRLRGDKEFYYLDFYDKGKRKREALSLFLYSKVGGLTSEQRNHNKENKKIAEGVHAERLLSLQKNEYGFDRKANGQNDFIKYYQKEMDKRYDSKANYGNWNSALKHLKKYSKNKPLKFDDITSEWVEEFGIYLLKYARKSDNRSLSQNTCHSYFNKVRACLRQAVKDGIVRSTPFDRVKSILAGDTQREYLTLDEVKLLINTKCDFEVLKKAFIFGCLTGLRWSDIQKLIWDEIFFTKETGYVLRYRQKKTGKIESLNITADAIKFLPEKVEQYDKVFVGLRYSAWHNQKLREWVMHAGIKKVVTFHVSRHTYATLLLTNGVDIYTVSKMLGHKHLSTTEVYAKIIDDKKMKAANTIKLGL